MKHLFCALVLATMLSGCGFEVLSGIEIPDSFEFRYIPEYPDFGLPGCMYQLCWL